MTKPAALVTGAASGIGRCMALRLARDGYNLTLTDIAEGELEETARLARAAGAEVSTSACDVASNDAQAAVFEKAAQRFGRLDLAFLNAGIGEKTDFLTSSDYSWEKTLAVDLTAVITGVRLASQTMKRLGSRGTVIAVASAAGYFPVAAGPVYAAAKAGVVHLVRSLGPRAAKEFGVRLVALCPQYVDTPLVRRMQQQAPEVAAAMMGPLASLPLLTPESVIDAAMKLAAPSMAPGSVGLLLQSGKLAIPFARADSAASPKPPAKL